MRASAISAVVLATFCAGCGGGGTPTGTTDPQVNLSPAIDPAAGPPSAPAPQESGVAGGGRSTPAPAWVSWRGHWAWLALGTYCYRGRCVDKVPPELRGDVPRLRISAGDRVTFHFGVTLHELGVTRGDRFVRLPAGRTTAWRVPGGLSKLSVFGRLPGGGDVTYDALLGPARRAVKRL